MEKSPNFVKELVIWQILLNLILQVIFQFCKIFVKNFISLSKDKLQI